MQVRRSNFPSTVHSSDIPNVSLKKILGIAKVAFSDLVGQEFRTLIEIGVMKVAQSCKGKKMDLSEVVKVLRLQQCNQARRTGECSHPACQRHREAMEAVEVAASLLEPAKPSKEAA